MKTMPPNTRYIFKSTYRGKFAARYFRPVGRNNFFVNKGKSPFVKRAVKNTLWRLCPSFMEKRYAVEFFPKIHDTGILFIHIPKAAGMSVSQAIYSSQIGHLKWSDIYNSNPYLYNGLLKIAICREPIERFTSAFYFLKGGGINKSDQNYAEQILHDISTANEFALALGNLEFRHQALRKVHFSPQVKFVCSDEGKIMVDHLIDFNTLEDDLGKILKQILPIRITRTNVGPDVKVSQEVYSKEALDVIHNIYAHDFELMNFLLGEKNVFRRKVFGKNGSSQ